MKQILVSGRVQGVSFRYNIKEKADELGLKGWVKNLDDGRVEIVVDKPEELIKLCKDFQIDTMEINDCQKNCQDFRIKY